MPNHLIQTEFGINQRAKPLRSKGWRGLSPAQDTNLLKIKEGLCELKVVKTIIQHPLPCLVFSLEELFCEIDDFCPQFEPQWQQILLPDGKHQEGPQLYSHQTKRIF